MEEIKISGAGLSVSVRIDNGLVESVELSDGESPEKVSSHPDIALRLRDYLAGKSAVLDLPLDASRLTAFQRRTFAELVKVPAGTTVSYQELASRAATPRHSRAVARALAANPFPLVIPCHRVVAKNGGLGGFSCGLAVKAKLLELEKKFYGK